MSNRKKVEEYIIHYINKLVPNKSNEKLYRDMFSRMKDNDFTKFINELSQGVKKLVVVNPNFNKNGLDLNNNLKIGKELKVNFFQRLWMPKEGNTPKYLTPNKYIVLDLPIRRQSQLLDKKISIPSDNDTVDYFTGQPAGKSKGAKVSYPETQVLVGMGLDNTVIELIKMRGGDVNGYRALYKSLKDKGHVDLEVAKQYSTGVESTRLLRTLLTGMHFKNNL